MNRMGQYMNGYINMSNMNSEQVFSLNSSYRLVTKLYRGSRTHLLQGIICP